MLFELDAPETTKRESGPGFETAHAVTSHAAKSLRNHLSQFHCTAEYIMSACTAAGLHHSGSAYYVVAVSRSCSQR